MPSKLTPKGSLLFKVTIFFPSHYFVLAIPAQCFARGEVVVA
jgi:hypothetical protein